MAHELTAMGTAVIRSPTIRVALHGRLRKEFGPEFHLGVSTPAAAIRALMALKPGFRDALISGEYRVRRGKFRSGVDLPVTGLILRIPPGGEMHIIPAARGAGKGAGKVIVGAIMVVAAVSIAIATGGAATPGEAAFLEAAGVSTSGFSTTIIGGFTAGNLALMGGAMMLSGIISLISPQPKVYKSEQSFALGGLANVVNQGVCVPLPYGRGRVGSVVVSIGYEADNYVPRYYIPPRPEDYPAPRGGVTPSGSTTVLAGSSEGTNGGSGSTATADSLQATTLATYVKTTGAGGSGKGGPASGGIVAPDTLFSKATVRIIDVLGEGPIGGLVNGAQSIYFNDTPLMASDGTYNFYGVTWEIRLGYPEQAPVPGFPASESSASIGLQVKQPTPVIQTITGVAATAARVTMQIPAAFSVDVHTGDISAVNIAFKIECQPCKLASPGFTGAWETVANVNLSGAKTPSPYEASYRFDLDTSNGADTWNIKVTRFTADSDDTTHLQNDTYWQLLDTIIDHQIMYSNTAYIAISIDAMAFGGSTVPNRTYEIYGRTIAVPANYNAATRGYSSSGTGTSGGTWDMASYTLLPSDNPAFILYDILTNSRYACGLPTGAMQGVLAELYVIAQYADGMISDGFGSTESRYSVNAVIASQDDAYKVIQLVASAMRAMTYWGGGQVFVSADMPQTIAKLASQVNVSDGNFEYQGTSLKTRPNLVRVAYLDANNRYLQTVEQVADTADIAKRGIVPNDIVGWGITSRGRAHRLAKWALYTAKYQTETVSFKGGFYYLDCRPGMLVGVSDPSYAGARMGGRLRSGSSSLTVLHLDSVFTEDGSSAYHISVVMPDGSVANNVAVASFANAGDSPDYTIVTLATALPHHPTPNAEWIITSTKLAPREFQVLAVGEDGKGVYSITGVNYDPNKFDEVESGLNFVSPTYSTLPAILTAAIPVPTNVLALDYVTGVGTTQVIRVTVSWTNVADPRVASYQVYASAPGIYQTYSAAGTSLDIDNLQTGLSFTFGVRAVGTSGVVSVWAVSDAIVVDGSIVAPLAPTGLTALGGTRRVSVNWIAIANRRDIGTYQIWRSSTSAGGPGTGATLIASVNATSFLDADSTNLTPNTTWYYWVRGVALGSPAVPGAFAGPVAGTTTLLVADDLAAGILSTASFAAGIAPVALVPNLTGTGAANIVYLNEADGQLYQWVAGTGAGGTFKAYVSAANMVGELTAGQIAAGAIGVTQLAAGSVTTTNLAADFQLTESSQIGTAVIGSAQIEHLSVGTINIADQAVTNLYATSALFTDYTGTDSMYLDFETDGSPVLVWGYGDGWTLYLGGTLLAQVGVQATSTSGSVADGGSYTVDTPKEFGTAFHVLTVSAGTHTLTTRNGAATNTIEIGALTVKK